MVNMTGMRAWISGTGSYLPARVVTNAEICQRADTTEEWIVEKLGIRERRIAAEDEQVSDLALHACKKALVRARLQPDQIDGILLAVGAGDVLTPATAGYVQQKLGVTSKCFAFDVRIACAGTIGAILMARGLIESGLARHILICGSHVISRTGMNWSDRKVAPIFGDGAGAVVVSRSPDGDRGILSSKLGTDGSLAEIVGQFAGGTRKPLTPEVVAKGEHLLTMDGRAVWDCAMREVPKVIREALELAGKTVEDVDFMISHQANRRLLGQILAEVGIPIEKTHTNVEKYGNTVAASALIALDEAAQAELIKPGDVVVLSAIGAGMTWGAHVMRW
jgi:3-oxoacyl-[acyl-carrier-protein] synthase III